MGVQGSSSEGDEALLPGLATMTLEEVEDVEALEVMEVAVSPRVELLQWKESVAVSHPLLLLLLLLPLLLLPDTGVIASTPLSLPCSLEQSVSSSLTHAFLSPSVS